MGGILTYGIPDFRLSKNIVNDIVEKVEKLGAKIKTNVEFGKDISLEELRKQYDAVFLGIGATEPTMYKVADMKLDGIYDSDTFLRAYNNKEYISNLGKVAVIGGGNVAMDSARAAIKMGAKEVKILYRRDRAHMPAREVELDEAIADGVEFKELIRVISANSEKNKMISLNCIKTEIVDGKAQDVPETEFIEDADTLVFAIGLKPNKNVLTAQGIKLNDWGMVEIDEDGRTNIENVYAGGDDTESKSTVCRALAAGKKAAYGIIKNIK